MEDRGRNTEHTDYTATHGDILIIPCPCVAVCSVFSVFFSRVSCLLVFLPALNVDIIDAQGAEGLDEGAR